MFFPQTHREFVFCFMFSFSSCNVTPVNAGYFAQTRYFCLFSSRESPLFSRKIKVGFCWKFKAQYFTVMFLLRMVKKTSYMWVYKSKVYKHGDTAISLLQTTIITSFSSSLLHIRVNVCMNARISNNCSTSKVLMSLII